jgi:hypothetical protein
VAQLSFQFQYQYDQSSEKVLVPIMTGLASKALGKTNEPPLLSSSGIDKAEAWA